MTRPTISFFHLSPATLRAIPSLDERLRYMGITALEMSGFMNPIRASSYTQWEREHDRTVTRELEWCRDNDWRVVLRLDDGFYSPALCKSSLMHGGKCLAHAARRAREFGNVEYVEVLDEMKPDPSLYPVYELADLWYGEGGPDLSFPGFQTRLFERMTYVGQPLARNISRQWIHRTATTTKQRLKFLRGSLSDLPDDDRPVTCLIPVTGPCYSKRVPGDRFHKGKDTLENGGPTVKGIEAMLKEAIRIIGIERFRARLYAWDGAWKQQRADAPLGKWVQTGLSLEDGRWAGLEMVVRGIGRGVSDMALSPAP